MENLSPFTGTGALSSPFSQGSTWKTPCGWQGTGHCWKNLWGKIGGFIPSGLCLEGPQELGSGREQGLAFSEQAGVFSGVSSFRVYPCFLRNLQPGDLGRGGAALPPRRAAVPGWAGWHLPVGKGWEPTQIELLVDFHIRVSFPHPSGQKLKFHLSISIITQVLEERTRRNKRALT